MAPIGLMSGKILWKASMKNVFALLLLLIFHKCVWSNGENSEKNGMNRVSQLHVMTKEELMQLTWVVDHPSEDVQSYFVTWLDGTGKKSEFWSPEPIVHLKVPPCRCKLQITVTVSPVNKDNITIGVNETMSFICQDIVNITSLKAEEDMIHASWSVRCATGRITGFAVMWHSEDNGYEMVCQFSGSSRNTSSKDGCHGVQHQLQKCSSYEVSIDPRSNTPDDKFLLAERASRTWAEECNKNVSRNTQSIKPDGNTKRTSPFETGQSTYINNKVTDITRPSQDRHTTTNRPPQEHHVTTTRPPQDHHKIITRPSVSPTWNSSTVDKIPGSYHSHWKTIVILAGTVVCCSLIVLALIAIAVWRKRRKKMFTASQVSTMSPNFGPLPPVPDFDNRRASSTESLFGHAYCYPNIAENVRTEILREFIELRDYPVVTPGTRREASTEILNSHTNSRLKSKKDKVMAALSLLARIQDEDDYNTVPNDSHFRSDMFREPQEEKLEEAIRLLNEFVTAGGGSRELSEIQSGLSVAESLGGHSYCYPQISKEVINRILSDAKKRKK